MSNNATSFNVVEDLSFIFNISVNNTDAGQDSNITFVNITLPTGFTFLSSSNGSSTSALTYKFQTQSNDGAGPFYFNRTGRNGGSDANGISTITVMEIKG